MQLLKSALSVLVVFTIAAFVLACAAAGVPYTSDPERKLGCARELYLNQHRPIPAERLIKEAIEIYQERNDQLGLARAYSMYGRFLQSPDYHADTFFNKREDYVQWKDRATDYFQKSLVIFLNQHEYHDASNSVLNLGILKMKGDRVEACHLFDRSLELHHEGVEKTQTKNIAFLQMFLVLPTALNNLKSKLDAGK